MAEATTATRKMGPVRVALNVLGGLFLLWMAWIFIGSRFVSKIVVDEAFQLQGGEMKAYTLNLNRAASVDIDFSSAPNGTDIICMHQKDLPAYEKAVQGLGGTYQYLQGLAGQQVIRQHLSGRMMKGSYACVAYNSVKGREVLGMISNAIQGKYQPKPPNTVNLKITVKG